MADVDAGHREHHDRERDHPVRDPHRPFPDVDPHQFVPRSRRAPGAASPLVAAAHDTLPGRARAPSRRRRGRRRPCRVEGVDGAQDLERLLGVGDRRADQRLLVGPALALARRAARRSRCSARRTGSCAISAVLDVHPVAERAARRLVEAGARRSRAARSTGPTSSCRGCAARRAPCWRRARRAIRPSSRPAAASRCRARPRGRASRRAPSGRRPACRATPSTSSLTRGVAGRVGDQHARQRAHLHRLAVVARRLQPGVLRVGVEPLVGRLRARCSSGFVSPCDGCSALSSPPLVVVPGVLDVLGDLRRIERLDLGEVARRGSRRTAGRASACAPSSSGYSP